jgi:hypothetical protein
MSTSSTYDQLTREHPAYAAGFARGRDVGLVIALNVITRERNSLADDLIIANATDDPRHAMVITYADGRLAAVQVVIAGIFRQANPIAPAPATAHLLYGVDDLVPASFLHGQPFPLTSQRQSGIDSTSCSASARERPIVWTLRPPLVGRATR